MKKAGDLECWSWMGSHTQQGYGSLGIRDRPGSQGAHRVAYELKKGTIPHGFVIHHLCKNPGCVNPNHLKAIENWMNLGYAPRSVPTPKPGTILKYSRVGAVRILRPKEYVAIHEVGNKTKLDVLLYAGLRFIEAKRLHSNPGWFDKVGSTIHLPPTAILKGKRRQLDRWIRLNTPGVSALESYLRGKPLPTSQGWGMDLKTWAAKAGVETQGLGPKTLRKTWESWLVVSFPERSLQIAQNQGHTTATSLMYYLNVPFNAEEKEQMKPFVMGVF